LLLEYVVTFANGSVAAEHKSPNQLYHILLDMADENPVAVALKGMCKNATRKVTWVEAPKVNLQPIFLSAEAGLSMEDQGVSIDLTLVHITDPEDYRIFDFLRSGNSSAVLDLIELHRGINAFDEWGQSALMMAVQLKKLEIVAGLLNTRMPKVNVNIAKSSGFTALFYAVDLPAPTILSALLRRGADPNASLKLEGSVGNTPLHFACMLEKTKHTELLLEYGAVPNVRNEHGQTPLDLLPRDAVRSTKLHFKRIFEEAMAKHAAASVTTLPASTIKSSNNEL